MNFRHIFLLLAAVAAFLRCANLAAPGGEGNGSETIARGVIVDSTGAPASGVPVRLLPAAYDPAMRDTLPAEWHAFTNAKGEYRLGSIAAGTYAIEAGFVSGGMKALVKNIKFNNESIEVVANTGRLRKTGAVVVRLTGMTPRGGDYVYLPGTSSFAVITARDSAAGQAVISGVPAGTFTDLVYVAVTNAHTTNLLKDTLTIQPGDTVASAFAGWKYAKRLFLNTTGSGADIKGAVHNFPILVRLNDSVFDFSQAKSSGEDIRFVKSDGSLIAYEIERWDAVNHEAEIWVKLDTVYGNDAMHFITLYWGNSTAVDNSNGVAVFDTAAGFAGVWHLGENGDSVHDATGNAFNGKNSGSTASTGIIGNSKSFSNGDYIRIPGLLGSPSDVTLSAWVRSDTSGAQEVISIGDAVLIRLDDINSIGTTGAYHNDSIVNATKYARVSSGQYLAKTGWHYLVFSINAATHVQTLYIDGTQYAISHDVNPINYVGLGADTYIGMHGNGKTFFDFSGQIDEVRVNHISVAADWIKLCYMNQRANDGLLVFR